MDQLTNHAAIFSLPGSRLSKVTRKRGRRLRRRKVRLPTLRAIVPKPKVFSKRRGPNTTVSANSDLATSGESAQEWIRSHWREYAGLWVALDGSRLVGEARGAREALEKARASGVVAPFLVHVTEPSELPFGGW